MTIHPDTLGLGHMASSLSKTHLGRALSAVLTEEEEEKEEEGSE